jgi:hypothetical protein
MISATFADAKAEKHSVHLLQPFFRILQAALSAARSSLMLHSRDPFSSASILGSKRGKLVAELGYNGLGDFIFSR